MKKTDSVSLFLALSCAIMMLLVFGAAFSDLDRELVINMFFGGMLITAIVAIWDCCWRKEV